MSCLNLYHEIIIVYLPCRRRSHRWESRTPDCGRNRWTCSSVRTHPEGTQCHSPPPEEEPNQGAEDSEMGSFWMTEDRKTKRVKYTSPCFLDDLLRLVRLFLHKEKQQMNCEFKVKLKGERKYTADHLEQSFLASNYALYVFWQRWCFLQPCFSTALWRLSTSL